MNIRGFFNSAYATTANAASSVYVFGKDIVGKGCSLCYSLTDKVKLVAGRFIPTTISNTVQAYPKSFACASGIVIGGAVVRVASRFFSKEAEARTENREIITDLNSVKSSCIQTDGDSIEVQQLKDHLLRRLDELANKYQD
ncbi:hypothetical protein [Candidatus Rhabdochlamydia porcellionis]|jgi:hypothetical protein|uniref:Uncharacterized protein n=1 Tax=Candidatus Rhabdochlamydia porcellionis TaxID=225148 RepID=A0ABX8Z0E3_9BACT|nr:hypothetical protein [Candidatus Rhabdochlamydia porcellionis]QZA59136.1 hypothetical protein RHAB15C_0001021 [Candidatus Rhabdochlamydia porcellionis]